MWDLIRRHPLAIGVSILGHVGLILAFVLVFNNPDDAPPAAGEPEPMKAVAVDEKLVQQEVDKRKQAEAEKLRKEKEAKQARERELKAIEDKRKAEEDKLKKAEAKRKREEKQRAEAEKKRKEAERKKAEAEKKRKAEEAKLAKAKEAERKRKEAEKRKQEEAKKKAAAEKKRKEEEARKQAEADKKRKAEEARKRAEAEKKRKEEEARRQAEAERIASLEAARAAEEAELANRAERRRLQTLRGQYQSTLRATVSSNWIQPSNLPEGAQCEVTVYQAPGGFILDVRVERCSGGGEAMRRSVELAVRKSEPLPAPPDPALFERQLVFVFKPE